MGKRRTAEPEPEPEKPENLEGMSLNQLRSLARSRALNRVVRQVPELFESVLNEERHRIGLGPRTRHPRPEEEEAS